MTQITEAIWSSDRILDHEGFISWQLLAALRVFGLDIMPGGNLMYILPTKFTEALLQYIETEENPVNNDAAQYIYEKIISSEFM